MHATVSQGGQNKAPHVVSTIRSAPQRYSSLQLAMVGWGYVEILVGWVVCFGMLFVLEKWDVSAANTQYPPRRATINFILTEGSELRVA